MGHIITHAIIDIKPIHEVLVSISQSEAVRIPNLISALRRNDVGSQPNAVVKCQGTVGSKEKPSPPPGQFYTMFGTGSLFATTYKPHDTFDAPQETACTDGTDHILRELNAVFGGFGEYEHITPKMR